MFQLSQPTSTGTEEKKSEQSNDNELNQLIGKFKIKQFPDSIRVSSEERRFANLSADEIKLCDHLSTTYESQISKCKFWSHDIIPRFVTDTCYIKRYPDRLKLTVSRFEQYLEFQGTFRFDDISEKRPRKIVEEDDRVLPTYFYGIDLEGHPIVWWNVTFFKNSKGIKDVFCSDNWERASFHLSRVQRMQTHLLSQINGHYGSNVCAVVAVIDLEGGSMGDFYENREFIKWYLRTGSERFPETLHKMFIINAPWAFQMIWKIIGTFLDASTVEKTRILGTDYMVEMCKYIDTTMIPKEFGGEGVWELRAGNVPIDFPFTMSVGQDNQTEDDLKDIENDKDDSNHKDNDDENMVCID